MYIEKEEKDIKDGLWYISTVFCQKEKVQSVLHTEYHILYF